MSSPGAAGAPAATEPEPAEPPARGTRIDGFEVTATVSRGRHATVLQARDGEGGFAALKLATTARGAERAEREARLLVDLVADAGPAPCLLARGHAGPRSYIALRWTAGSEPRAVAAEIRERGAPGELLGLCRAIARAYAALHERGVVHGQVHPRHLLVDRDGSVGVLDLSLAASATQPLPAARVPPLTSLSAPEHATAALHRRQAIMTPAGEQYAVAAMLYLLATGKLYARLRLERATLARDIAEAAPLAFAEQGAAPWPELEAVLARALRKVPEERFASLGELCEALAAVAEPARREQVAEDPAPLARTLDAFRRDAGAPDAIGRLPAPTCSVNFGAAGVAYTLMRLGTLTGDAAALASAERWLSGAERDSVAADAFDDGDELTPRTVGPVSPYHTASGVAAVRALLSDATGDAAREQAALDDFRLASAAPCEHLDLTLGRSSVLLFCALLYARADRGWPAAQRLRRHGDSLLDGIWRDADGATVPYLGIAHGWAGIAYASLMWAQACGVAPASGVAGVLDRLVRLAEPHERGACWPVTPAGGPASDEFWPGWCHGTAGYVFLWNLARDAYRDEAFAGLAERAAWLMREHRPGITSLCCGSAGGVYALLNQYRATGEASWRSSAARLARRAAAGDELADDATTPLSLYKGHAGLALLAAELDAPDRARMPLFEFEPAPPGQT